jgi:hypothetical protein
MSLNSSAVPQQRLLLSKIVSDKLLTEISHHAAKQMPPAFVFSSEDNDEKM